MSGGIDKQYNSILNDILLEDIACKLGSDWWSLGCHLQLPIGLLDDLQESVRVPVTQMPIQMLKLWKKTRSTESCEIADICDALIKTHRRDLTYLIRNNLEEEMTVNNILIAKLSDCLVRDWFTLGIYLGLSYTELTIIKESIKPKCGEFPASILLRAWKAHMNTYDKEILLQDFLKALKNIKRNDLVLYVQSRLIDNNDS